MIHVLLVDLEDFYNGTVKTMKVKRKIVCKMCSGTFPFVSYSLSGSGATAGVVKCHECTGSGFKVMVNPQMAGSMMRIHCPLCQGSGLNFPMSSSSFDRNASNSLL